MLVTLAVPAPASQGRGSPQREERAHPQAHLRRPPAQHSGHVSRRFRSRRGLPFRRHGSARGSRVRAAWRVPRPRSAPRNGASGNRPGGRFIGGSVLRHGGLRGPAAGRPRRDAAGRRRAAAASSRASSARAKASPGRRWNGPARGPRRRGRCAGRGNRGRPSRRSTCCFRCGRSSPWGNTCATKC